ncbi:CvfB family protein [Shewanella fidelis]|uniref:S1-like domain-containing RNA-binding protein n=1 Tax=Shewanella fidelis TaxID=173509 RepID=A0AAW8NLR2_9GAMM|nr:S1-like domain-containing RNA-binding protein [Shewanella fidelis]MDR8524143.1 S1-like domain-containing RNA-binding protein [Shewanella fidelis]MDW4810690.1 S1-like domain-containing RNA-binding protein [Shewanella fidelis]MDW4814811.1 S1-like domain-containing RNA-binding protein [Shewanella fidelis]MDW4818901.1 S1-like domain-containing RNA-binding protein [Shewanella fidelis]MDW4823422.1 S1-like domain-containing RNA-binding protein [Shewanella fidelis]
MIQIGKTCKLEVVKQVDFGVYLDAKEMGQVLLPRKAVPKDCQVGDMVNVFLYLDSEDMVIATTRRPYAQVGEFAYLEAKANGPFGAFLDWGLDKDLLLPFGEQHREIEVGKSYLVYIYTSHVDDRIVASSKVEKFLDLTEPKFRNDQEVNLIIGGSTDLGYKAIINNSHWGVLYKNEVYTRLSFGQKVKGFIKRVRTDGKIDLILQKGAKSELDKHAVAIMIKLKQAGGFLPLNDKTDAEVIYSQLSMSKKAFKKSIGGLYKNKQITITTDGIRLED